MTAIQSATIWWQSLPFEEQCFQCIEHLGSLRFIESHETPLKEEEIVEIHLADQKALVY